MNTTYNNNCLTASFQDNLSNLVPECHTILDLVAACDKMEAKTKTHGFKTNIKIKL